MPDQFAGLAIVGILPGMMPESVMADIQAVIAAEVEKDPSLKVTARPSGELPMRIFEDRQGNEVGQLDPWK